MLAADAFAACPSGSNLWFCSRAYDTATQAVSVLQDHHRTAPLVHTPAAFLAASDLPCALPRHCLPCACCAPVFVPGACCWKQHQCLEFACHRTSLAGRQQALALERCVALPESAHLWMMLAGSFHTRRRRLNHHLTPFRKVRRTLQDRETLRTPQDRDTSAMRVPCGPAPRFAPDLAW